MRVVERWWTASPGTGAVERGAGFATISCDLDRKRGNGTTYSRLGGHGEENRSIWRIFSQLLVQRGVHDLAITDHRRSGAYDSHWVLLICCP